MESEGQAGGGTYKEEAEASRTAQKISRNSEEPTAWETAIKATDRIGRIVKEKRTEKEISKRGRPTNVERLQRIRADSEGSILDLYGRKKDE